MYREYHESFDDISGQTQSPPQQLQLHHGRRANVVWSCENVNVLVRHRMQTNPTCFKTIADQLNELEARRATVSGGNAYTARDCQNKWHSIYPSRHDMYSTLRYLRKLQTRWPGTVCKIEPIAGTHKKAPQIRALHIVWPWARDILSNLSKTVFCDATFHVTIYGYKVVCFTTLDGNHHHRPLMVSFIQRSVSAQWKRVFNLFHR